MLVQVGNSTGLRNWETQVSLVQFTDGTAYQRPLLSFYKKDNLDGTWGPAFTITNGRAVSFGIGPYYYYSIYSPNSLQFENVNGLIFPNSVELVSINFKNYVYTSGQPLVFTLIVTTLTGGI